MNTPQFHSYSKDDLFDKCFPGFDKLTPDQQEDCEIKFEIALEGLIEEDLVIRTVDVNEDELITPSGGTLTNLDDFIDISKEQLENNQLQKSILGCLKLHKSIFNALILYCQFDKSNQQGIFIANAIKNALNGGTKYLPVIFVIGDNLSSLMDQTMDGFHKLLCKELNLESDKYEGLMCLKGDEKTTQGSIENYIGNYLLSYMEDAPKKLSVPVILALNNKVQIQKVTDIHQNSVVSRIQRNPNCPLRSGFVFDEFDKVYRSVRPTFKPILVDNPIGVLTVLGVTGSEDGICEEFPEWATSNLVRVEIDADKEKNHRGIHHDDAKIHKYKQKAGESNNMYAVNVINQNRLWFTQPRINPKNGKAYFPKVLILADVKIAGQKVLAQQLKDTLGFHIILQNEKNLKIILKNTTVVIPWSINKKVLRDELFKIFNQYNLWNAPVALIGNRKLDRGLGYHYAPPGGGPGLIWNDEIMGFIAGDATRVQKVSRLHGVIGQCDDYPNELHFWTDERTGLTVRNENGIIKSLHENYQGFISFAERLSYAKKVTVILKKDPKYRISESFPTRAAAREWFFAEKAKEGMKNTYNCSAYGLYTATTEDSVAVGEGTPGITHIKYRGDFKEIWTYDQLKELNENDGDIGQGANDNARIMPVLQEGVIQFVVIYIIKKDTPPVE